MQMQRGKNANTNSDTYLPQKLKMLKKWADNAYHALQHLHSTTSYIYGLES